MPPTPLKTFYRVAYTLKGKILAEVTVEAASEAQAKLKAAQQVKLNLRRLADETTVEPFP